MARVWQLILRLVLLGVAACLCGCPPPPPPPPPPLGYQIEVSTSKGMGSTPVEVHFVALSFANHEMLTDYSMTKYWRQVQRGQPPFQARVLKFQGDEVRQQVLRADDPVWARWISGQRAHLKDMHLYVLADLTGVKFEDQKGTADARRLILPLDPSRWASRVIRLEIRPTQIVHVDQFRRD